MSSAGEPSWVTSGGRSLAAWVHRPDDGRARGALIIAPSLGLEQILGYRALRVLAVEAARRGFVAVRFNWSGEGDSELLSPDVDPVAAYRADLAAVAHLAREASGIDQVDAVGLRVGGALLAVADELELRSRVLWEPIGGRMFLRHHQGLRRVAVPEQYAIETDGVELVHHLVPARHAESLRALPDPRKAEQSELPAGTAILEDSETAESLLGREQIHTIVPFGVVRRILGMLEPGTARALPAWSPARTALLALDESGAFVRETMVEVGPRRLPGILTEPAGDGAPSAAALLVTAAAGPKMITPMPELARTLAARGTVVLRADRGGIGDAADTRSLVDSNPLTESGTTDVAELTSWLQQNTAAPVTGIGVCAGAWLLARASEHAPLSRIVMVNNMSWDVSTRRYEKWFARLQAASPGTSAVPVAAGGARPGAAGRAKAAARRAVRSAKPLAKASVERLKRSVKFYPLWRLLSRLWIDETAETLLRGVRDGVAVVMIFGDEDRERYERSFGAEAERRLGARGYSLDVIHEVRLDHSAMSQMGRSALSQILIERVFAEQLPAGGVSSPGRVEEPAAQPAEAGSRR